MNTKKINTKYVGMDVHRDCISIAVLNEEGRQVSQCIVPSDGAVILEFVQGLRGTVQITCEETTQSAWLYDLLQPHVSKVVVCNPRKNALLKVGNKNDKLDARKLAELLRGNQLSPVYHGQNSARALKELGRAYTGTYRRYDPRDGAIEGNLSRPGGEHAGQGALWAAAARGAVAAFIGG